MYRIVLLLVAVGAAISWLVWQQNRSIPLAVSGFIEADQIRVGSRVGGRLSEVLVSEGQRVRPGDALLRLDEFDLREQLAEARAVLAQNEAELARLQAGYRPEEIAQAAAKRDRAQATLQKLLAGPRPREIEIAKEQRNIARANLELAESEFQRLAGLREGAQAAKTEFDEVVRERKRAYAEVATAEQELALLEEGTRTEELAEARAAATEADEALKLLQGGFRKEDVAKAVAQVDAARARVAAIETQMKELTVVSPCDCVIEAVDLRPGDIVPANAPSLSLLDASRTWVRTYVPESRLGEVRLGQTVPVRADSFPDRRFNGRITFIATEAEFTPRNIQTPEERSKQVFRMKVTLEEGLDVLRVGMGADVLLSEAKGP